MLLSDLVLDIVCPNSPSDPTEKLSKTLSVGLKGVRTGDLLSAIVLIVALVSGSACHESGGCILNGFDCNGVTYI